LIGPSTWNWDHELLEQTFWGEDAEIIKTVPVHQDMDDVVAWHFVIKGSSQSDRLTKYIEKIHGG